MAEMPFYVFMRKVFLIAPSIPVIAPMLGVFLVIRRQSLMAGTLLHVSLTGVALSLFFNWNPNLIILIVMIVAATILEYLRMIYSAYSETPIAILISGDLASALVLMNLTGDNSAASIQSYLFGPIVTITWDQVVMLVILFVVLILLSVLSKHPMHVLTFDEDTTHVDGLPIHWVSMPFSIITDVAIAAMIPITGVLLISVIMALPAAIGMRIGKGFNTVIVISVFMGLTDMLTGSTSSYCLETPPSTSITLVFVSLFLLANIYHRVTVMVRRKQKIQRN